MCARTHKDMYSHYMHWLKMSVCVTGTGKLLRWGNVRSWTTMTKVAVTSVCFCAHVSVCLNVCTCECNRVSSLIALTLASVKWDGLPLSVFKSVAQKTGAELNWWVAQASSEMKLLALIETVEESYLTLNQKKTHLYAYDCKDRQTSSSSFQNREATASVFTCKSA